MFVAMSLPAAGYSTFLLLRREKLGRRWYKGVSVVQTVPRLMMNEGIVDQDVQRQAVDRQPSRPARVHGDTGTPT